MNKAQQEKDLQFAIPLALEVGALAAAYYARKHDIRVKSDGQPVTTADIAANEVIIDRIRDAYPEDAILSEEGPQDPNRTALEHCWMIDPIDGTREFIAGSGEFAVHIARAHQGTPMVGVVYKPSVGHLYYGAKDLGAFQSTGATFSPITVNKDNDPKDITLAASRAHKSKRLQSIIEAIQPRCIVRMGSVGLKVSAISCGQCHAYVHPSKATNEWDTAAPQVILEAAGGTMTDLSGEPLRYLQENPQHLQGIAASNTFLHKHILGCIEDTVSNWLTPQPSRQPQKP